MMNHFEQKLLAGLCLLLPAFLFAQTTRTLSLDDAIRLGMEHSIQLQVTGAKLNVAQAKRQQYANAAIPALSLNSNYNHLSNNVQPFVLRSPSGEFAIPQIIDQYTNRLSASEVVFSGFRVKNLYESARFLEKAAVLDVEKDKIEVRNNLVNAYCNYYKLLISNDILAENRKVLKGRLTDIENFVKEGTALENDQLKASIALSQLELSQKDLANAITIANYNLNLLLGLPTETSLVLERNQSFGGKPVDQLPSYLSSFSTRPDLAAADLRKQAAAKSVAVVRGSRYPVVSIGANAYYSNPNPRVFPPTATFKGTWDIGVGLSYNLTNLYTSKFQVQEAKANMLQAGLAQNQLHDAAMLEINSAYLEYGSTLEKITLMEKIVVQATENQRVVKNRYQNQLATIGELLDADTLVFQTKANLESAKADAEMAYYKLLKSVGK